MIASLRKYRYKLLALAYIVALATTIFPIKAKAEVYVSLTGYVNDQSEHGVNYAFVGVRAVGSSTYKGSASTDINGNYSMSLTNLEGSGSYEFDIKLSYAGPYQDTTVPIELNESNEQTFNYTYPVETSRITGVLTYADGSLPSQRSPNIISVNGSGVGSTIGYVPDNGQYVINVLPGVYDRVSLRYGDDGTAVGYVSLNDGANLDATTVDVTQDLTVENVPITVQVKDAAGNPLVGYRVYLRAINDGNNHSSLATSGLTAEGGHSAKAYTDSTGYARFPGVKGFEYESVCVDMDLSSTYCTNSQFTLTADPNFLITPTPDAPTPLTASSPTKEKPVLSWQRPNQAVSEYRVYRNGSYIGSNTDVNNPAPSYTDSALSADGSHSYYVTAKNSYGFESVATASVAVVYDTTPPTVASPSMSSTFITPATGPVTISANSSDALTGVSGGEYYVDLDPGNGNGQSMLYSSVTGEVTASSTIAPGPGQHTLYIRAKDVLGNWGSTVSVQFFYLGL